MLAVQPFIGGASPLFADYIVFGALQWARIVTPFRLLDDGDVVAQWFERCLDLHDGLGRKVAAAARQLRHSPPAASAIGANTPKCGL